MGHLDKKRSNVGKFIMLIYIKLTVIELLIGFNYKYRNPSKNVHSGIVFDVYDKNKKILLVFFIKGHHFCL
jgi:hypothetical protein